MPMTYDEAIDALYAFINYELQRQDRYSPDVMTLERPAALLAQIGDPQAKYPIVHITGTKGKGSVGAMSAAILQAAGYKVGLYSSPHLQDFRERFQINGALIPKEKFAVLVDELLPTLLAVEGITWFEVVTALAFEYFAREQVDVAVIEVGLGGRLDATNVATPIVSVITSLSYDHMYLLGNSLAEIAFEKAGIIKPNVPVVSAPQPDEAAEVLIRVAAERASPLTLLGRDWQFTAHPPTMNGQSVTITHADTTHTYTTALLGEHQAINTAVVVATMAQVAQHLPIAPAAIEQGLKQVNWPARLEVVRQNPLLVLDAAHNRASANWLKRAIEELFARQPLVLVFGAKADKDIRGMLDELLPITQTLIIAQAVDSRAESPDAIELLARELGFSGDILTIPPVGEAIATAQHLAGAAGMVCVTGSLYVAGEARTVLNLPIGQVPRVVS